MLTHYTGRQCNALAEFELSKCCFFKVLEKRAAQTILMQDLDVLPLLFSVIY